MRSPEVLLRDASPLTASRPWLRAYADASQLAVDRQVADCVTAIDTVETLELRRVPESLPTFRGDIEDDHAIEEFAGQVRAAAKLADDDVVSSAIRIAERRGCVVLPMGEELGRHLGLSLRVNEIPVVCVSRPSLDPERDVPGDRQRLTLAHELGHLTLHAALPPPTTSVQAAQIEK